MKQKIGFENIPAEIYHSMSTAQGAISGSDLPKELTELVNVYISSINGCAYCIDMHMKEALHAGIELQKLYSLVVFEEVNYFSELELASLRWARELTNIQSSELSDTFDALNEYLNTNDIAMLTLSINHMNNWNRIMKGFGIEAGTYTVGMFEH
jgi:AhpD family alkylhydroperoxidase